MSWFRIDDSLPDHPKVEQLESDHTEHALAMAAWTLMGADCAKRETDGIFTEHRLRRRLPWPEKSIARARDALLRVGLWRRLDDETICFHDFNKYNPTKAQAEKKRASKAARMDRWRGKTQESGDVDASQDGARDGPVDAHGDTDRDALGDAGRDASRDAAPPRAFPARPGPTRPHDRSLGDDPGAGDAPAPEAEHERRERPSEGPTPAGIVEAAYVTALGAAGGKHRHRAGDHVHFRDAGACMRDAEPDRPLRDVAADWCAAYVAERRSRSPAWLAEWCQKRLASGSVGASATARGSAAQSANGHAPDGDRERPWTDVGTRNRILKALGWGGLRDEPELVDAANRLSGGYPIADDVGDRLVAKTEAFLRVIAS